MPETIKPDLSGALRVNVVGCSGSGKSTFSKALADILEVRHIEMDALFWGPDWYWPSDEEFFGKLRTELSTDAWVLDGNYTRTIEIKWEKVDMVIWLDPGFPITFFRSVKRAFKRSLTREELWEGTGNRESFRQSFFSRKSVILWSVRTFRSIRRKYETLSVEERYSHIRFVRLRTRSETEAFLERVRKHHELAQRR
ncbi:MAG: adenylate kinase [Verrucomicrobiota bacterium]